MNESVNSRKHLSLFGFFALSATMVMTIYEYPTFASSGVSLVFYFVVAGLFCFLTVALCAAEMARLEGVKAASTLGQVSHTERNGGANMISCVARRTWYIVYSTCAVRWRQCIYRLFTDSRYKFFRNPVDPIVGL
ncbi:MULTISPECIES: hypothetical protein [Vibrio]|uniref:hypothetical protein n=1 Tax=Vibrio TaxID=662 RepID=UPI000C032E0E|nr:hypothetical protein [Vibrio sp. PID17_43]PHJ43231.1 hypothetical protein AK965_01720 [Vibrio sp. PID17_43]